MIARTKLTAAVTSRPLHPALRRQWMVVAREDLAGKPATSGLITALQPKRE